ncbi:MAG: hypothetical protein LBD67_03460 [Candidatus Accumulibacter sp.]|jgi:hypothetical protein|nr:hypothetical protein [Accumulibacter sp.]
METRDPRFGARFSLVRARPPHRARHVFMAMIWSAAGILMFVFKDALLAEVSTERSARLYFFIMPGLLVLYGAGLFIYTQTRPVAVLALYKGGIIVKLSRKEQRIALRDIHYFVMNSQGLAIRDKNGESLGEIPHEVFGDRVYLAYAFLKESVQPRP